MTSARDRYLQVQRWSPLLIRMAVANLTLLVIAMVGLLLDDRLITGAPAWLKPAKFGASTAIYLFTLAWMVRSLPPTRWLRIATPTIAWLIMLETTLICVQAARGTSSHFNVNTSLDGAIFASMGIGIATVWVMSAVLLWQHWRTPPIDRAMALALRLGLALNILGAGVGWLMTQPRPSQVASMQRGERPFVVGSHTVGAPDGGPGMPITKWSAEHGDLRVPHFIGMHALQLLPLLLLGLRRLRTRRDDTTEQRAIWLGSAVCAAIFVSTLLQALGGHPLLPPSVS